MFLAFEVNFWGKENLGAVMIMQYWFYEHRKTAYLINNCIDKELGRMKCNTEMCKNLYYLMFS